MCWVYAVVVANNVQCAGCSGSSAMNAPNQSKGMSAFFSASSLAGERELTLRGY
jgi:hypothetical protein